ncbi:MAG: hypothetical protein KAH32_05725 [Chlamydiia bacterium]|nr:hypothetical protein [Chlamydiia bacterium]
MYLLYVKGRGYYTGHRVSTIYNYKKQNVYPTYKDMREHGLKRKIFIKNTFKITFKRDSADVSDSNAFRLKSEAKAELAKLKAIALRNAGDPILNTRESLYGDTVETTYTDASLIAKAVDKIEIIKVDDFVITKTSKRQDCVKKFKISKTQNEGLVCDMCRVTLVQGEAFININYNIYCKHCLDRMFSELKTEFDKNPLAKEITSAWDTEMVVRAL